MPLVATRGAASAQGFGEFARVTPPVYIEDVFSTYLYTGTSATQTITNGIDLSGKGGLLFAKGRSGANSYPYWIDSARGVSVELASNFTAGQTTQGLVSSFNSNGFTLSSNNGATNLNRSGDTYVSWTFREQAKFFDVVTYTGNGATNRTISHNLGSTPGCIIIKDYGTAGTDWIVYHRGLSTGGFGPYSIYLNLTNAQNANDEWGSAPTSSVFTVNNNNVNGNGKTYVAYLFAHNAGGFGATGTDNVISCGSYTGNGNSTTPPNIELGWEPQWILLKESSGIRNWVIVDNMRGLGAPSSVETAVLNPNLSNAESAFTNGVTITATGFQPRVAGIANLNGSTNIYIAIRRGPMKTPTSGTSVFVPITATASTGTTRTVGFAADMLMAGARTIADYINITDRLRGFAQTTTGTGFPVLKTALANAENTTETPYAAEIWNTTARDGSGVNGVSTIWWYFGRAPGFFDEVCYTGTSAARTISHNLTVVPELIIVKSRSATNNWTVYSAATGNTNALILNSTAAVSGPDPGDWNSTTPTASVFSLGGNGRVNASAANYVAYLFASCPGVSKVGSYTGTGALQTINCGFASGARFVLIKRTDTTGDWWVYDSARGISSGNDPYLFLNSTAAEVTNTNYVDTTSVGFQVTAAAPAGLNANGGTYIFLAIS